MLRVRGGAVRALVLALVCVTAWACQSTEAKKAAYQSRGEAYATDGRHAEAIIEFKNVLQIDPNAAAAHWGLAKSYLALNKVKEGYWELRETARLDPTNLDAKLQYGQLARLAGENDEALKQADELIAADPKKGLAYVLRGQALELLKRPDEAKEAYLKAVEVAPAEPAPLLLLGDFYVRQGDNASAEPLFRRLAEAKPGFQSGSALAGFLARDKARSAEAEAAYKEALSHATPEELSLAYRTLASFYYTNDRFDDAEATLNEALEKKPGDLDVIYSLARFYAARGDDSKADAMVEAATKAKPDDVAPYLVLSAYRGRKKDLPGALAAAESALAVAPDSKPARLRKAELLLDIGYREGNKEKIAEGRSIADAVLATDPNSADAMFVKAKMDMAEGHQAEAATELRHALDIRPDWAQAKFLLGSALFFQGDRNGARAEVTRALEIDADLIEARKLLTSIQASLGEDELAIEEGRKVLRESPDDVKVRILVAQSLVRRQRFQEALKELEQIPEPKRDAETVYAFGRVYLALGKIDEARERFEAADAMLPNQPDILNSLLIIDKRNNQMATSLQRLERAVAAAPNNAKIQHLYGLALAYAGRPTDSERALKRSIELDPNDVASYQTLAQLLAVTGRRDESLETYKKALAARPDSAALNLILGSLYEGGGDTDKAIEHYQKAVELDPNLAAAKNNLAYLLAEQGKDLDRALDLAQEAKAGLPDNPNAADTLGWVLYKKGVASAAVGYLREAEGGTPPDDPSLVVIRLHLVQAYEANNEPNKARETAERAVASLDAAKERPGGGQTAQESPAATQLRSTLERLKAQASAAPAPEKG